MLLPSLSRYEGFLHSFFAVAASLNPSWLLILLPTSSHNNLRFSLVDLRVF